MNSPFLFPFMPHSDFTSLLVRVDKLLLHLIFFNVLKLLDEMNDGNEQ